MLNYNVLSVFFAIAIFKQPAAAVNSVFIYDFGTKCYRSFIPMAEAVDKCEGSEVSKGKHGKQHDRQKCVFCRIYDGKEENPILHKDGDFIVFPDIKPAATHHYLIITKEHIPNVKQLRKDQKSTVEKMIELGKKVLEEQGADMNDVRFGFHWPPFNSVSHLHLHAISPTSEIGFIGRLIFRPDSMWFVSAQSLLEYVESLP